jgi:predicted RNA-binding Zn-ribbon protein involved in translation (DUF1610 family)
MWLLIGCLHCKEVMTVDFMPEDLRCPNCGEVGVYTADFRKEGQ